MEIRKCIYCQNDFNYPQNGKGRMCKECYNERGRLIYRRKYLEQKIVTRKDTCDEDINEVTDNDIIHFVNRVESDKLWVTIYDINTIITLYTSIAERLYDYDKKKPGEQIQLMWKDLVKYRDSINKKSSSNKNDILN